MVLKKIIKAKVKKHYDKKQNKQTNYTNLSYGSYAFAVGLLIALISSLLTLEQNALRIVTATLIVFSILIGTLNITNKETTVFLISTIALVVLLQPFLMSIAQAFQIQNQATLKIIGNIFLNITTLVVPAAIIVSIKALFRTAKDE